MIKKCQHKYIIGSKGSVLNEIFKTTGVSIEMPTDPDSEQIILRGEQEKLGKFERGLLAEPIRLTTGTRAQAINRSFFFSPAQKVRHSPCSTKKRTPRST